MERKDRSSIISRRHLLRQVTRIGAATPVVQLLEAGSPTDAAVNTNSAPTGLKITDVRGCTVNNPPFHYPIIRIDTNQGVHGLGELFTHGGIESAFIFKQSLVGQNPLDLQGILREVRRFVNSDGAPSGAVGMSVAYSAIDIALHDIAGKVYGVPVWRLLGSKMRERIRVYCDTVESPDPAAFASRMLARKKAGYTFLKMDLRTRMVANKLGAVNDNGAATDKGLKYMCEYLAAVRDAIGWDAPLAADHFGELSLNDCIRYARAFEPYQLAWAEDLLDYHDWQGYKLLSAATTTPTLTGEYAFGLKEIFRDLLLNRAVDIIHPDVTVCGGLLELRRIGEFGALFNVPVAIHACNSPVAQAASVHAASVLSNFMVLEYHQADCTWWKDLVKGPTPPAVAADGHIPVSNAPGLGVELNEEAVKPHLLEPQYFEPTPLYDSGGLGGRWRRPRRS